MLGPCLIEGPFPRGGWQSWLLWERNETWARVYIYRRGPKIRRNFHGVVEKKQQGRYDSVVLDPLWQYPTISRSFSRSFFSHSIYNWDTWFERKDGLPNIRNTGNTIQTKKINTSKTAPLQRNTELPIDDEYRSKTKFYGDTEEQPDARYT